VPFSLGAMHGVPMDEYRPCVEAPFHDDYEPCAYRDRSSLCGSIKRTARFYMDQTKQIGFFCDQGHACNWETGGKWIPHDVFEDDGLFSDMLPSHFKKSIPTKGKKTSLNLNERRIRQTREAECCAQCDCPPFTSAGPMDILRVISEFRRDLYERIHPFLARIPNLHAAQIDWQATLPQELQADIHEAQRDSRIDADHGIPRSKLERIYNLLSTPQRRICRDTLVLPLCHRCNRIRGNSLYSTDRLLEYYAKAWHNGNRYLAARQDEAWFEIQKISAIAHHNERSAEVNGGAS